MKLGKILVLEDNQDLRELITEALELYGFNAVVAGDGQQGLDYLSNHPKPSLILLDLMMPVKDGYQFKAELDLRPDWADIPVVITTADDHVEAKMKRIGAKGFLQKPVSIADLIKVVEQYVSIDAS